jgi:uncharacterized protein with FMN-binding domain
MKDSGDGDDDKETTQRRKFKEWECPTCEANNPIDDGFYEGDELHCFYCGIGFAATVKEGRLKMIEL